jgi:tetratricopeptide (TPR) repeat protein
MSELKGIPGATQAWAVLGASSVESRFEALHGGRLTAFVGRDVEIECLLGHWERAKAGEGQVVCVSGEAGVGKSRLTAEFLRRIVGETQVRYRYYCSPWRRASAVYPVIGQIERAAGFSRGDDQKTKLDKLDAFLAPTATSARDAALIADLMSLANDGRYPPLDMPPAQRRQGVMRALIGRIEAVAHRWPVVMVLEDAHWADPTTLELVDRLIFGIGTLRALLLVIYRPELNAPWIARDHVTTLALDRLTSREIRAMIGDVAGKLRLPASAQEEIVLRADGIPLFAEEMTKAVLETEGDGRSKMGDAATLTFGVPASLHASLMARLDRLGPAKEVAQIAAAIGRASPHALLAMVAEQPEPELDRALDRLVDAGLLLRQGSPPAATYQFKHALLQDLAYSALLRERRRVLHARIAEALEVRFPEVGENTPELLARHWAEAGFPEKAAALWGKAGRQSLKRSALGEAESHFSRALAEIAAAPPAPSLRREEIACQIGLAHAQLLRRGYTSPEAKASLSRTLELIEKAEAVGEPVKDPLALFTTLHGLWLASVAASSGTATQKLAAQCLALAESGKAKGEVIAGHHAVGLSLLFAGDVLGSRAHFDQAIALFNPAENHHATRYGGDHWSSALSGRGTALWLLGYADKAKEDLDRSLEFARNFGHPLALLNNLLFASWTHFHCGRYALAKAQAAEIRALAEEKGGPFYSAFGLMIGGLASTAGGEIEKGVEAVAASLAAYRAGGATLLAPDLLAHLARAQAKLGQFDRASRSIAEAIETMETSEERWCEADIFRIAGEIAVLAQRDEARAEACFDRALAAAHCRQLKSWELRAALCKARLLRNQGRRAEGRALLASAYGSFTEGFDTLDLKEAKTLLDELWS